MVNEKAESTANTGREATEHERIVSAARCPSCGDTVFVPKIVFTGDTESTKDITVWCIDHGHWIGRLSECAH